MAEVKEIIWQVVIDGKLYKSGVGGIGKIKNNQEVARLVDIVALQMKWSLQKAITGKSDLDKTVKEAKERFKKLGER